MSAKYKASEGDWVCAEPKYMELGRSEVFRDLVLSLILREEAKDTPLVMSVASWN